MAKVVVLNERDNVATCLIDLKAADVVDVAVSESRQQITLAGDISFGHKFAVAAIAAGEEILKYGEVIGVASTAIAVGEYVHVHNVESVRARSDKGGTE